MTLREPFRALPRWMGSGSTSCTFLPAGRTVTTCVSRCVHDVSVHSPGTCSRSHRPWQPRRGHRPSPYWLPWLVMDNRFGQSRAEQGEMSAAVETGPPPPHRWMCGFLNVPEYLPECPAERRICLTQALQPPQGRKRRFRRSLVFQRRCVSGM